MGEISVATKEQLLVTTTPDEELTQTLAMPGWGGCLSSLIEWTAVDVTVGTPAMRMFAAMVATNHCGQRRTG
jgi:saccharopine dehydrogenase-like NADP-dependent oxidoreductase